MTPFLLHPLDALGGGGVAAIKVPPLYQHIKKWVPWVGEFAILQYDHGVPDVSVEEMHP